MLTVAGTCEPAFSKEAVVFETREVETGNNR